MTRDVRAVTPIRVDRFGLTLRLNHGVGSTCARLKFDAVLRDPKGLRRAMVALQIRAATVKTCPFTNRPRNTAPPA